MGRGGELVSLLHLDDDVVLGLANRSATMTHAETTQDRIAELAVLLQKYKDAYYNQQPLVSDAAYDALEEELRSLAPEHPILSSIGAPVPSESGGAVTAWEKARHAIPMGSLNKAVSVSELREWAARCDKLGAESGLSPISTRLLVTE